MTPSDMLWAVALQHWSRGFGASPRVRTLSLVPSMAIGNPLEDCIIFGFSPWRSGPMLARVQARFLPSRCERTS